MSLERGFAFSGDEPAGKALRSLRRGLAQHGAESPAIEARCLVEAASGLDRATLIAHADRPLGREPARRLADFAERRLAGEPLARILGAREFWGLSFTLSGATLEPRPETETLVAAVLRRCEEGLGSRHAWRILDLGTGSGCIAIALLTELPSATALGVDRSVPALMTARENAEWLGVARRASWIAGDWTSSISCASFDILVSNPPYVMSSDIPGLAREVRDHDPHLALDGGQDGLDCCRSIAADATRVLRPGGRVLLEIGAGQERAVRGLLEQSGLTEIVAYADLAGVARVVSARRPDGAG